MNLFKGLLALCFVLAGPLSHASDDKTAEVKEFFKKLYEDPKATLNAPPERFGATNRMAPQVRPKIHSVQTQRSLGETDQLNKVVRFYPENDFKRDFNSLFHPDNRFENLDLDIWSGDYWATYKMGLAKRYTDPEYPSAQSYEVYINYFKSLGPIDFSNPEELDKMSPAEKYDLLVMDSKLNLTNWSLFTSQSAYSTEDGEEKAMTWAGLCHGWAPAAFAVPRPLHSVTYDLGFAEITFRPDDIKALATLLWAQAPVPNRFIGGRCNKENPDKDEFGRVRDPECFDINPAAWHTVLVNHAGIRKQSFVIDATYDLEVWNQPIKTYEANYFNPATQVATVDPEEALIPIEEYTEDIFKSYRSKKTKFIMGVVLDLAYLVETHPTGRDVDSEEHDAIQTVRYFYDLEFDENKNLVGGEWYHVAHPDFIWAPMDGATAESFYDRQLLEEWDEASDVPPRSWMPAAQQASRQGMPLAKIVNELVRRSRMNR